MVFNIRGMIAERKAKAREQRDIKYGTKLEKADRLHKQRVQMEKEKSIADYERGEKAKIRSMKTEGVRRFAGRVGSGLKKARAGIQKQQAKSRLRTTMGSTSGSRDVFGGGRNVFSGSSEPKPRKKSGKRIIIQL